MNQLTIQKARNLYNRGYIIQNRQNNGNRPRIFQLLGYHFTSNKHRALKGKRYKIDNQWWFYQKTSLWIKLYLIVTSKVFIIKHRKKKWKL